MREDFLHFLWQHHKIPRTGLKTTDGTPLQILNPGSSNSHSGPDFFNARIELGLQMWAGNVELHVRSSDWYLHKHQSDPAYKNVILHVVWEDDIPIFLEEHKPLPTLELKSYVSRSLLDTYRKLFRKNSQRFINCENDMDAVPSILITQWKESLYAERLAARSAGIENLLDRSCNDWEWVLFAMLLKNFGLNVNGEAFSCVARQVDFSIIRKIRSDAFRMESLLFGLSGLLNTGEPDGYRLDLEKEYSYLCARFSLTKPLCPMPEFTRLRPANFPTIRLSQFARLYYAHPALFAKLVRAHSLKDFYGIFDVTASPYWDTHFTFGRISGNGPRRVTKTFIHLLLLNTLLPLLFCYARHRGQAFSSMYSKILEEIPPENNRLTRSFERLGLTSDHAGDSQALLQLYRAYCRENRCLECVIGCHLLGGK